VTRLALAAGIGAALTAVTVALWRRNRQFPVLRASPRGLKPEITPRNGAPSWQRDDR